MKYLSKIIQDIPTTHFYSSEKYGKYVAEYLNITERNIDMKRECVNISATDIRNDIESNKEFLSKCVYNDLKKK